MTPNIRIEFVENGFVIEVHKPNKGNGGLLMVPTAEPCVEEYVAVTIRDLMSIVEEHAKCLSGKYSEKED